jgi:hypothetical protein
VDGLKHFCVPKLITKAEEIKLEVAGNASVKVMASADAKA